MGLKEYLYTDVEFQSNIYNKIILKLSNIKIMVGKVKNYLVQQRLVKASENKTSILDYQRK